MKYIVLFFAVVAVACASNKLHCSEKPADIPEEWIDMVTPCINAMRNQVQEELNASMQYLAMGAHFARDTVNRPGFAEMFFKAAGEEREHAQKILSYLLMRGQLTSEVSSLITMPHVPVTSWTNAVSALKDALRLEAHVTEKIRNIIKVCEGEKPEDTNDYHLVDYLTGDFLTEQLHGQRDLAGKISTLDKMMATHGALGEFLYDKKLGGE